MPDESAQNRAKSNKNRRRFLQITAAGATTLVAGCAGGESDGGGSDGGGAEQDYPNKSIRFVIPYDPGGGVDFWSRTFFPTVGDILGISFEFENISGAGGTRGQTEVAQAEPDGYTMFMGSQGYAEISNQVYDTSYDWTEFETGGVITEATREVVFANPELEIEGFSDLFGRYQEGDLETFAVGDDGGSLSATFAQLRNDDTLAEDTNKVAYTGSGPTVEAVVTGEAPAGVATDTSLAGQGFTNELTVLGTVTEDASQIIDAEDHANPDELSLAQAGFPAYQRLGQYNYGVYYPDGTPQERIQIVADAMEQAMENEEVQEQVEEAGNVLGPYRTPEEHETIRDETWEAFQEVDVSNL